MLNLSLSILANWKDEASTTRVVFLLIFKSVKGTPIFPHTLEEITSLNEIMLFIKETVVVFPFVPVTPIMMLFKSKIL